MANLVPGNLNVAVCGSGSFALITKVLRRQAVRLADRDPIASRVVPWADFISRHLGLSLSTLLLLLLGYANSVHPSKI